MTINRFCSSGLQALVLVVHRITEEAAPAVLAGGLESISLVQDAASQGGGLRPLAYGKQA